MTVHDHTSRPVYKKRVKIMLMCTDGRFGAKMCKAVSALRHRLPVSHVDWGQDIKKCDAYQIQKHRLHYF